MKKRWLIITITLVLILVISGMMIFRTMKEKQIYNREIERIHFVIDDQIYEGENYFIKKDGKTYIRLGTLKDLIYDDYRMATSGLRIITGIKNKNIILENQYLSDFVKSVDIDLNFPIKKFDETDYIDMEKLSQVIGIQYEYAPPTGALIVDTGAYESIYGSVVGNNVGLYQTSDRKSYRIKKLNNQEKVKIFKEKGDWLKIRTQEGLVGYVLRKKYN